MKGMLMTRSLAAASLISALILCGCGDGTPRNSVVGQVPAGVAAGGEPPVIEAEAGVPVVAMPAAGAPDVMTIAKSMGFGSRSNAFALMAGEMSFDRDQLAARIASEGGFRQDFEEPEAAPESRVQRVPIPLWRLAGTLIGDGVTALLDMGGQVIEIRPGMQVPGSDWVVISIDEEKAVLRNTKNVDPKEVTIKLQSGVFGAPAGGGGGGGGGRGGARDGDGGGRGGGSLGSGQGAGAG